MLHLTSHVFSPSNSMEWSITSVLGSQLTWQSIRWVVSYFCWFQPENIKKLWCYSLLFCSFSKGNFAASTKLNISYSTTSLSSFQDVLFYVFSTLAIYSHFAWQHHSHIIIAALHETFISALVLHRSWWQWSSQRWSGQVG